MYEYSIEMKQNTATTNTTSITHSSTTKSKVAGISVLIPSTYDAFADIIMQHHHKSRAPADLRIPKVNYGLGGPRMGNIDAIVILDSTQSLKALGDVICHDLCKGGNTEYARIARAVYRFLYRETRRQRTNFRTARTPRKRPLEQGNHHQGTGNGIRPVDEHRNEMFWSSVNCWKRAWQCSSMDELVTSLSASRDTAHSKKFFDGSHAACKVLQELKMRLSDSLSEVAYFSRYTLSSLLQQKQEMSLSERHLANFNIVFNDSQGRGSVQTRQWKRVLIGVNYIGTPDLIGCHKFMSLVVMYRELIVANAWISTLGGGYYLCKNIERARIMAEKQTIVARLLRDESMEAKANVHFVYNDIMEREFERARQRVNNLREIGHRLNDSDLMKMLHAAEVYCNKVEALEKDGIVYNTRRATGQKHPLLPQSDDKDEYTSSISDDFYRQRPTK